MSASLSNTLGLRLWAVVLFFSSIMSLAFTVMELHLVYQGELQRIERQFENIETSYRSSLEHGLWYLYEDLIENHMLAISELSDVIYVELITPENNVPDYTKGYPAANSFAKRFFRLYFTAVDGKRHFVGTMQIQIDLGNVYHHLWVWSLITLVSQFIKTLIITWLVLYLFNRLVTRHIKSIVAYLSQHRLLTVMLQRDRSPPELLSLDRKREYNDELQYLVGAINEHYWLTHQDAQIVLAHEAALEREIIKRKQAEKKIRQQYDLMTAMIEPLDIITVAVDQQYNIILANNEAAKRFDVSKDDLVGLPLMDLLIVWGDEAGVDKIDLASLIASNAMQVKLVNVRFIKIDKIFPTRVIISPLVLPNGELGTGILIRDISIERELQEMNYLAYHDILTGLPNRSATKKHIDKFCQCVVQGCVCLIDLDNFKDINDNYGHAVGDQALKHIAKVMWDVFSEQDFLARQGGDEFVVITRAPIDEVVQVCQNFLMCLQTVSFSGSAVEEELFLSASIGIARFHADKVDFENVFSLADKACYSVKKVGGGGVQIYAA